MTKDIMGSSPFDEKMQRSLLNIMLESRLGDQREQSMIRQGKGWFHISSAGHEAMAAVGIQLGDGDYCAPYYRDRAMVLAKGMSSYEIALNFLQCCQTIHDRHLNVEDHHIDRMMMNLERAGMIENLAGLIIGGMTDMNDNSIPFGETAEQIIWHQVKPWMQYTG